MQEEVWSPIEVWDHVINYEVSSLGNVRNQETGRLLRVSRTRSGPFASAKVGLMVDGVQRSFSLSNLVAKAFVEPHRLKICNTPINLNGDRMNNKASNLMWRPLWFAREYHNQFYTEYWERPNHRVRHIFTGEEYEDARDVCVKYGQLLYQVSAAAYNRTPLPFEPDLIFEVIYRSGIHTRENRGI